MRISFLLIVVVSAIVGASNSWAFAPGLGLGSVSVYEVTQQPDGKFVVVGDFEEVDGTPRNGIARLHADGTLDASFQYVVLGASHAPKVYAVTVQGDGKVVITGTFREINSIPRSGIARLNSNGTLDSGFDPGNGLYGYGRSLALQPDGRILVGGSFDTVDNVARGSIARLNADGSLDTSFDPAGGTGGGRV